MSQQNHNSDKLPTTISRTKSSASKVATSSRNVKVYEDHGLDEIILTKILGWKWMTFVGIPHRDTYGYPNIMRVRQLFSPKAMSQSDFQEKIRTGEMFESSGQEPLSYAYSSSHGPEMTPRIMIVVDNPIIARGVEIS